jgi:hypothetical protein
MSMDLLAIVAYVTVSFMAVVAVLAILMPFFVLRIRNELVDVNRKLERLIRIAEKPARPAEMPPPHTAGAPVRFCRSCGAPNPALNEACSACHAPMPSR